MESLILPLAIFLAVAIWGVAETGRKFRTEFKKRGKTWGFVMGEMARGEGTIIVDMLWGPQRGLGHPVIWWSPRILEQGRNLVEELESSVFLVRCPRAMRTVAALQAKFGPERVMAHSWSIDPALTQQRDR